MDKRSLLALVLCLVIFVGWMWLSPKIWPTPPPAPPKKPDPTVQAPKPTPPPDATKPDPAKPAPEPARHVDKPAIPLTSKVLDAVFTNKGAGVESAIIQHPKPREKVKEGEEKKNQVPVLRPFDPRIPHLAVRHVGGPDAIESLPWEIVEQKADRVEFRYRLRNGVEISKVLVLSPDRNTIEMTLLLSNKNPKRNERVFADRAARLPVFKSWIP